MELKNKATVNNNSNTVFAHCPIEYNFHILMAMKRYSKLLISSFVLKHLYSNRKRKTT